MSPRHCRRGRAPASAIKKEAPPNAGLLLFYEPACFVLSDAGIIAAPPIGAAGGNRSLIKPAAVNIAVEPRRAVDVDTTIVAAMMMAPIVVLVPGMIPVAIGMAGTAGSVIALGYGAAVDAVTRRIGTIVMNPTARREIAARDRPAACHTTGRDMTAR